MKIKWIGVDCGSADHPMNTIIAQAPEIVQTSGTETHCNVWRERLGRDVPSEEYLSDYAPETLSKGTDPC